jgi:hypothetical protein
MKLAHSKRSPLKAWIIRKEVADEIELARNALHLIQTMHALK